MQAVWLTLALLASIGIADPAVAENKPGAGCTGAGGPENVAACTKWQNDLTAQIQKSPNDDKLYVLRSDAYDRMRDFPKEIEDLNHAITLKPSDTYYLLRATAKARN